MKVDGVYVSFFRLSGSTVSEASHVVRRINALIVADLNKRFANIGIFKSLYVLSPSYVEPQPAQEQQEGLQSAPLMPAIEAWSKHFSLPVALLLGQFRYILAAKSVILAKDPTQACQLPYEFWPGIIQAHEGHAPEICRCLSTFITLAWQNASVERDLSIIKHVKQEAINLSTQHLDGRARIIIEGPEVHKPRGNDLSDPFLRATAKTWTAMARRQIAPHPGTPRGKQGSVPQRAPLRSPGPLDQASAQPSLPPGGEATEDISLSDIL
jgi:hypothetical protein